MSTLPLFFLFFFATDPSGQHKTRFVIRIIPCVSPATFKLARLAPDRNCVRARHVAAVRDGSSVDGVYACFCNSVHTI